MAPAASLSRGAYILTESKGKTPEIILIATGSEVYLAVTAMTELEKRGHAVRVVSMPSYGAVRESGARLSRFRVAARHHAATRD